MTGSHPRPLTRYTIRVTTRLDARWADWFDGFSLSAEEDGTTTLVGVADQSLLHGLLTKIRDLGLDLISVTGSPRRDSVASTEDVPEAPDPHTP